MWERNGVVRRRFMLGAFITAGLLALLLLVGVVAGPLSMWLLEWRTLATTPKVYHYFVKGCASTTNLIVFLPWGLVGLIIGASLLGIRSRTMDIILTLLAVGWQVPVVWLVFQLGVGWCGDPDGASLVSDATPGWLRPAWLAWLAIGIALSVSRIVALICSQMSPKRPAGDTG